MLLRCVNSVLSFQRFASSSSSLYDVVIVGGGLVGNAMACAIANSPLLKTQKVLLLESEKPKSLARSPPNVYGIRVSAVNPSSKNFFKKLGVWDKIANYRVCPVTDLYVLDSCSQSSIRFEQLDNNSPIAHIIENDVIISALYDKLRDSSSNVTIQTECGVASCTLPSDLSQNAKITLNDGQTIEASLVIGADGAKSRVRQAMGTDYTSWDYEQSAIVCTLNVSSIEKSTIAWQRFTPLGPIALLPLAEGISSLVWTTSVEEAQRLLALAENDFVDELNNYLFTESSQNAFTNQTLFLMDKLLSCVSLISNGLKPRLHLPTVLGIEKGSKRASFPLGFGHSNDYVTTRCALIGDAAHRVHPLAGQGVNLGWFDVQSLTKCLESAVAEGGDLGSVTYLKDYDSESQYHNVPVMLTIDALKRLYNTQFSPLVFARSLGLHTLDKILPLKDLIMSKAST